MTNAVLETKPVAWSYSALDQFLTCPKQYAEIRVFKNFTEPNTEQRDWGNHVHQCIALALKEGKPLPPDMDQWQPIVDQFSKLKGELIVEQQWAFDHGLQSCEWFSKDTWLRVIVDALWIDGKVAKVVDWKTGKRRFGSHQLELFAAAVFARYPQVQEVRSMFVWLKSFQKDAETFKRSEVTKLWNRFLPDVHRLEYAHKTMTWIPKTSGLCNAHCPVTTCTFNGRRRQ